MPDKKRLDILLVDSGLVESRTRAKALIMAGKVFVDQQRSDKPGVMVYSDASIEIKGSDLPYVSRGGLKLAAAIEALSLKLDQWVCLDVGASTGDLPTACCNMAPVESTPSMSDTANSPGPYVRIPA